MSIGLREKKKIKLLEGTTIKETSDKSIILMNIDKKKLSEECNRILKIKDLRKNRGKGIKIRKI
jgi:ribosomal protein L6P/L9E